MKQQTFVKKLLPLKELLNYVL